MQFDPNHHYNTKHLEGIKLGVHIWFVCSSKAKDLKLELGVGIDLHHSPDILLLTLALMEGEETQT